MRPHKCIDQHAIIALGWSTGGGGGEGQRDNNSKQQPTHTVPEGRTSLTKWLILPRGEGLRTPHKATTAIDTRIDIHIQMHMRVQQGARVTCARVTKGGTPHKLASHPDTPWWRWLAKPSGGGGPTPSLSSHLSGSTQRHRNRTNVATARATISSLSPTTGGHSVVQKKEP